MPKRKLLLIGWDAADWRVIDPLLAQGALPNLARLIEKGVRGNIRTLYPVLSPMLWTSIATGKRPYKHGIHGFSEVCPESGAIRPISGLSRKTKAVWNILGQNDLRSNVIGWWPSHPAEPIRGAMVSNFYKNIPPTKADFGDRLPNGTAHPERLLEELAPFRVHPDEFNQNHLLPFLPNLQKMDWKNEPRVHTCAKMLAECTCIHAAATGVMQLEPWDFMGIYYDAIDHFCHGFMKYHPPRREGVTEQDFENFKDVINASYHYHDLMLGTLIELAGDDTTILLISDHGFHPDHLRPAAIPLEPAGPATEHRSQGIFVATGPEIPQGKQLEGISLLDITPTILHHFGLAVGKDMDGRVLRDLFTSQKAVERIPSWDEVPGDDGSHSTQMSVRQEDNQAAIEQLVALGYIEKPNERIEVARAETQRELDYNLARAHMDGQQFAEGAAILQRLWETYPEEYRFAMQLLTCLERLGKNEEANTLLKNIIASKTKHAEEKKDILKEKFEDIQARLKEGEEIPRKELIESKKLYARTHFNRATLAQLEIRTLIEQGDLDAATLSADKALKAFPENFNLLILRARLHTLRKDWKAAELLYKKILEQEPLHEPTFISLAYSHLCQKQYWHAAANAQQAVDLTPQNPWAHYYYGCATLRLSKPKLGIASLQRAVRLNPDFVQAWDRLARYFSRCKKIKNAAEQAAHCRAQAQAATQRLQSELPQTTPETKHEEEDATTVSKLSEQLETSLSQQRAHIPTTSISIEQSVTIVSGLPRSGSSLLMQMLVAGGIEALTDNIRQADENNPRGFFEYEPVKKAKGFDKWMPDAQGKVVKIIAPLISAIPKKQTYRVVMCHRPLNQILASQDKMLNRLQHHERSNETSLEKVYLQQMNRALAFLQKIGVPVLIMDYVDIVSDPAAASVRLNTFFNGSLNQDAMARAVDPSLHRER